MWHKVGSDAITSICPEYDQPQPAGEILLFTLFLSTFSHAAGLDLLEVGGVWGTPGAENPTAVWWNPARLTRAPGTQILIESAYVTATVDHTRTNPNYGTIDPELAFDIDGDGILDTDYDYSGTEQLKFSGFSPFLGASSDLGTDRFALGAALFAPYAKGGASTKEWGPSRYANRDANINVVYTSLAAAYQPMDWLSVGLAGSYAHALWDVNVDVESYTILRDECATNPSADFLSGCGGGEATNYQDGYIEAREYATTLDFHSLPADAFTVGGGFDVIASPTVAISLAYQHGLRLEHAGDLTYSFQCPNDIENRAIAVFSGLCTKEEGATTSEGVQAEGTAKIGYNLPGRLQGGVVWTPNEKVRIEAMGGYVFWHVFTDYEIQTKVTNTKQFPAFSEADAEYTAQLVSQDRKWARDSEDAMWAGVDGKVDTHEWLTLGGRILVDTPSVPTNVLSTNNLDAVTLSSTVAVFGHPMKNRDALDIGLSFSHYLWVEREVTNSKFSLAVNPDERNADRYFYPSANGTYGGSVNRLALSVRGQFGGSGS